MDTLHWIFESAPTFAFFQKEQQVSYQHSFSLSGCCLTCNRSRVGEKRTQRVRHQLGCPEAGGMSRTSSTREPPEGQTPGFRASSRVGGPPEQGTGKNRAQPRRGLASAGATQGRLPLTRLSSPARPPASPSQLRRAEAQDSALP